MPFTGKATFDAGADLPELAEDVADIVSIVAAFETPLLDHLGDPRRAASSTIHEWLEDSLLPNSSTINQTTFTPSANDATSLTVTHGSRFRIGDQVRAESGREVMLVTAISSNVLTVVRGYGGTSKQAMSNGLKINIIGNAALEGDDRPATRFTNRSRKRNYTQIFSAAVEVSGSMRAVRLHGVADEVDYQKQERIREILRDLEHSVIAGVAPASAQQGSSSVRRTMNGIIPSIVTNAFEPGVGGFPQGTGAATRLDDAMLNAALRRVWEESGARPDTIVVSGTQKRRINEFMTAGRRFESQDTDYRNMVNVFESDFGVCRVILSRWVPTDACLVLDSSRIAVLPLAGRSLQFKTLASGGDSEVGMVVGEYTLEFKNESAHGMIRGLEA